MITEADTCRKYVLPKLYAAGWNDDQISEQKSFTDGRILVVGTKARRRPSKRADYLLRYARDFMLAVVEAKAAYKLPGDGLQQAKDYAEILEVKFAYSTNGHGIVEFDFITGQERQVDSFPKLGEVILDPACGTGGFLVESFKYLEKQCQTVEDRQIMQTQSIFGGEAKSLPYLLAQMNLVLHGLESPKIDPLNSLRFPLREIGDRDRVDIIMTNPPFGGEEERGILGNFPEDKQTSETALLFLQLIMRKLRRPGSPSPSGRGKGEGNLTGGRAAVVVPNGALFGDGICLRIKEELLKDFNLHTIVRLPNGVFAPYTSIPTNLLFFDRSHPTEDVWYYEQPLPEGRKNYTKTQPIQFEEFAGCLEWWNKREESERAWKVPASELLIAACNLDRKNPTAVADFEHLPPEQLADDILKKKQRILEIMAEIKAQLAATS